LSGKNLEEICEYEIGMSKGGQNIVIMPAVQEKKVDVSGAVVKPYSVLRVIEEKMKGIKIDVDKRVEEDDGPKTPEFGRYD
jgi:hypothetical protein